MLQEMEEKYVSLNVIVYASIVDGYTKQGLLNETMNVMKKMV